MKLYARLMVVALFALGIAWLLPACVIESDSCTIDYDYCVDDCAAYHDACIADGVYPPDCDYDYDVCVADCEHLYC